MLQRGHASISALNLQNTYNEQSLPFNVVALIFLFKEKIFPPFSFTMPTLSARLQPTKWKILYLPYTKTDYSSSGIMLYTE